MMMLMSRNFFLLFCMVSLSMANMNCAWSAVLFEEKFEDANLAARGWYDSTTVKLSSTEHIPGSTRSIEYHFPPGATVPEVSGGAMRKKFSESDAVYISYYVRHSQNWVGSGRAYHPHIIYLLTNLDGGACGDYCGLSVDRLTVYIEENSGKPVLALQDVLNIDQSRIGQDLTNVTEQRAVAGCNGYSQADGSDPEDCYRYGSTYRNAKTWRTSSQFFQDAAGAYYKGDWHHVEAFFKLNDIVNGKGIANGELKYWYDGTLVINHANVLFRTGQYPNMRFNQFVVAPYIGDGSPVDQAFWIDDLTVATSRPVTVKVPSPPVAY